MSFGDVAAQAILECCLKRMAKTYKQMDLIAALMVEIDRFVDDLPSGSDFKEIIERLRGEIMEDWQTTGTLAALFAKGCLYTSSRAGSRAQFSSEIAISSFLKPSFRLLRHR